MLFYICNKYCCYITIFFIFCIPFYSLLCLVSGLKKYNLLELYILSFIKMYHFLTLKILSFTHKMSYIMCLDRNLTRSVTNDTFQNKFIKNFDQSLWKYQVGTKNNGKAFRKVGLRESRILWIARDCKNFFKICISHDFCKICDIY